MTRKHLLKAYKITFVSDQWEDVYPFVFSFSKRGAKSIVSKERNVLFKDFKVSRATWVDKYKSKDIPVKVWFEHGFKLPCAICGCPVDDDCDYVTNGFSIAHSHCRDTLLFGVG